jgi:hypothetical protein
MWKLMDNLKNKIYGEIIPILCMIYMILTRDLTVGILGLLSILTAIAWGDKDPSIVEATPEMIKEMREKMEAHLKAEFGVDKEKLVNGIFDEVREEINNEKESRRMIA